MRKFFLAGVAGAALALASAAADAAPLLSISAYVNGTQIGTTVTSASGFVPSYSFTGSGFTVSGTAYGAPFSTSPNFTNTSTSVISSTNASGTVSVIISDTGLPAYNSTERSTLALNTLTASAITSATVTNYFDQANTVGGTGTQLATLSIGPSDSQGNGTGVTRSVAFSTPFSESTIYTYVFGSGSAGQTVQGNSQLIDVPEPASMALVGMGLAVVGLIRRRRAG